MASKDIQYGYEAGWMDARNMVYEALEREQEPAARTALLALVASMGPEVRTEKRHAYAREVESY